MHLHSDRQSSLKTFSDVVLILRDERLSESREMTSFLKLEETNPDLKRMPTVKLETSGFTRR